MFCAQVNFESSGNGDGGPGSSSVSKTVYSSVYADFCVGQPIQQFLYAALISKNLLASAGQAMDPEATSSSATPGTTTIIGFRGSTAEGLRAGSSSRGRDKRLIMATEAARAAALVLQPPQDSPETKKVEKRKLVALANLAESKASTAKMEELALLEDLIAKKKSAIEVQEVDSPSEGVNIRMLQNMQKRAAALEATLYAQAESGEEEPNFDAE